MWSVVSSVVTCSVIPLVPSGFLCWELAALVTIPVVSEPPTPNVGVIVLYNTASLFDWLYNESPANWACTWYPDVIVLDVSPIEEYAPVRTSSVGYVAGVIVLNVASYIVVGSPPGLAVFISDIPKLPGSPPTIETISIRDIPSVSDGGENVTIS